ncbi:hypothetical protein NHQ30_009844 [Ciborinia camelliae]|nr:hypothetical protein NHQ30_009844 [Ciborinia camelliae]
MFNSCISKDTPSLLLVSREARAEVLQRYEQSFGTRMKVKSAIYFNYELDAVIFNWKSFGDNYASNCMRYEECCRIKRIHILDKTLDFLVNNQMRDLSAFTSLEEVSISECRGRVMKSGEDPKLELFQKGLKEWLLDHTNLTDGQLMPKLVCLESGGNCSKHVWFREWNEWAALTGGLPRGLWKESWTNMFTNIYREVADVIVDVV